jgi:hypothetical protein
VNLWLKLWKKISLWAKFSKIAIKIFSNMPISMCPKRA